MTPEAGQRVIAVTGGGGGIGAAIAEELGRQGAFVVTMDPLVTLDGSEVLPAPEETTAGRIVAGGGSARATSVSVTDGEAIRELFAELPRLDAVINVAGISRPTGFAKGTEADWRAVLSVHLDGYLNVLRAALPIMAAAGHGRILGVTSGSGWRAADAGAYSCAKRAVAALTWQLGRAAPPGVLVNAISPIAVTRMVTAALGRATAKPGGSAATGGLSLGSMPEPEELGPLAAHLVGADFSACQGRVLFAGGSEVALVDEPRLLEVSLSDGPSLPWVLEAVTDGFAKAEADQASAGGSNPRFAPRVEAARAGAPQSPGVQTCAVVGPAELADVIVAALAERGVTSHLIDPAEVGAGFAGAATALGRVGPVDGVVIASRSAGIDAAASGWEQVLREHDGIVDQIHADAAWARAVADHAAANDRLARLVTVTDASNSGGRSRAHASAQLARAARGATGDRVSAFAVAVESRGAASVAPLVTHLLCSPDAAALSGAELVTTDLWFGVRSHPRPAGSLFLGGAQIPAWFDDALGRLVGEEMR